MFVTFFDGTIDEGTPTYERVQELLSGTADAWVRHASAPLRRLRPGQRGLLVDNVENRVAIVEVTDVAKDGNDHVFA